MNPAGVRAAAHRERVAEECALRGKKAFVAGCLELLVGRGSDTELILVLGGRSARWLVSGEPPPAPYWLVVDLQDDPSARVRAAANRALVRITAT